MSTSTTARLAAADDPRNGTAIGVAAYAEGVHNATRFGEMRNSPGSGSGDPRFSLSVIAYNTRLRELMDASVNAALIAVVNDHYPSAAKLPPRGLRGVQREPLRKLVASYPKMWPDCPDKDAIFIRANSYDPPLLVDQDGQALSPENAKLLIKSGAIVRILFRAYHYEKGGDPGIGLGLNAVQYLRPGFRLGRYVPTDALAGGVDDSLFADLDV
jgi:hypothetical protein